MEYFNPVVSTSKIGEDSGVREPGTGFIQYRLHPGLSLAFGPPYLTVILYGQVIYYLLGTFITSYNYC